MTKDELRNLRTVLQRTVIYLDYLQKLYNDATGVDFRISGPMDGQDKMIKEYKEKP